MYKQAFGILLFTVSVFFFWSCGNKKVPPTWKQVKVEITGLDGNGVAEEHIRQELFNLEGVKSMSFNYLEDQVIVLFDSTKVSADKIIKVIGSVDNGKHKVLEHEEGKPEKIDNKPPDPPQQDEIGDEIDYGHSG